MLKSTDWMRNNWSNTASPPNITALSIEWSQYFTSINSTSLFCCYPLDQKDQGSSFARLNHLIIHWLCNWIFPNSKYFWTRIEFLSFRCLPHCAPQNLTYDSIWQALVVRSHAQLLSCHNHFIRTHGTRVKYQ